MKRFCTRTMSLLLALTMIVSLLPVMSFAADAEADGITAATRAVSMLLCDGTYTITSAATNSLVLTIGDDSTAAGAMARIQPHENRKSQKFIFVRQSNGYYTIRNYNSFLYLQTERSCNTDFGTVFQRPYSGDDSQLWQLEDAGGGYCYIACKANGLFLSISTGDYCYTNSDIQVRVKANRPGAKWQLKATDTLPDGTYSIRTPSDLRYGWGIQNNQLTDGNNVLITQDVCGFTVTHTESGLYTIRERGKKPIYVDVEGGRQENGANLDIWSGPNANQYWHVVPYEDNTYSFVADCNGRYADMQGGGDPAEGKNMQTYEGNGTAAQRWDLYGVYITIPLGLYQIEAYGDHSYVLEAAAGSTAAGTGTQLAQKGNSAGQKFAIEHVDDSVVTIRDINSNRYLEVAEGSTKDDSVLRFFRHESEGSDINCHFRLVQNADGSFGLSSVATGQYVDLDNGSLAPGTKIHTWRATGGSTQKWWFTPVTVGKTGTYFLASDFRRNMVMDVANHSVDSAANVQYGAYSGHNSQKWRFIDNGDGYYVIQNVNSGRNVNVANNNYTTGANVIQYSKQNTPGGNNERWSLIPHHNGSYSITSRLSGLLLSCDAEIKDGGNIATRINYNELDLGRSWSLLAAMPIDNDVPVVSNIRISELEPGGFRISVRATDSSGIADVYFEAYTDKDGRDDVKTEKVFPHSDGTASVYVSTADHSSQAGDYSVTINAYDRYGKRGTTTYHLVVPVGNGWFYGERGTSYYTNNRKATGLTFINGKGYYFDEDGIMQTGKLTLDGKEYRFGSDGAALTGWQALNDEYRYYFGQDGQMYTGWHDIDGERYYFYCAGDAEYGLRQINSEWYYFDPVDCHLYRNRWVEFDGYSLYFGNDGKMLRGWHCIDGEICHFGTFPSDGAVDYRQKVISDIQVTDQTSSGFRVSCKLDGSFNASGVRLQVYTAANGEDDLMMHEATLSGGTASCYISFSSHKNEKGVYRVTIIAENASQGWSVSEPFAVLAGMKEGWNNVGGKVYFVSGGAVLTGWQTIEGTVYFFNDDGVMQTGVIEYDGSFYYLSEQGGLAYGYIIAPDGSAYYADADGKLVTGWMFHDGRMCFFSPIYNGKCTVREPVISNIQATQIVCGGYRITCELHPEFHATAVTVSTWTEKEGKDDLVHRTATISDNIATLDISAADHNGEAGSYLSQIRAVNLQNEEATQTAASVTVPAHSFRETVTKPATCTEAGSKTMTCTICGVVRTETIPSDGQHLWDDGLIIKAATCSETGYKLYACTACGFARTEVIPVNGQHTYGTGIVLKAATCSENGYILYTCTACGFARTEIVTSDGQHKWNEGVVTKEANCKEDGSVTYTCTVCGTVRTEVISSNGQHLWDDGILLKAATCGESGYKLCTCTICGFARAETIPATGEHQWDSGVVTKPATATEAGEKTFTCTVCKATKTESIPMESSGELAIANLSLSLKSDFSVNFYVEEAVLAGWDEPYMLFTKAIYDVNGNITGYATEKMTDYVTRGNQRVYIFRGISASEMSSRITATLYATKNGRLSQSPEVSTSVRSYAGKLLAGTDRKLNRLLVDMLNYGSAAQIYWNYNPTKLANRSLTPAQAALATAEDPVLNSTIRTTNSKTALVHFAGVSLLLKEKVTIRYYINRDDYTGDTNELSMVVLGVDNDGTEWQTTIPGDQFSFDGVRYTVTLDSLSASQMRTVCTARVYHGADKISGALISSVDAYAASMQNDPDPNMAALVKAMMKYGDSTSDYFGK